VWTRASRRRYLARAPVVEAERRGARTLANLTVVARRQRPGDRRQADRNMTHSARSGGTCLVVGPHRFLELEPVVLEAFRRPLKRSPARPGPTGESIVSARLRPARFHP
jgi:hypothetical protein